MTGSTSSSAAEFVPCTGPNCGRLIRWGITVGGARMPLDVEPVDDGNVVPVLVDGAKRWRVLTGPELPAQVRAWQSHHRTCPDSEHFKRLRHATTPKCRACGFRLDPWLVARCSSYHVTCAPPTAEEIRAGMDAGRAQQIPAPRPVTAQDALDGTDPERRTA